MVIHPDFATHWAQELGADIEGLAQLSGGINNQVFLCRCKQRAWVIKAYQSQKPGLRDRMRAEVDFLRYSAHVAPRFTPELIKVDAERRCIILEHIEGKSYPEGANPGQKDLEAAFHFFRKLNHRRELAKEMIKQDAADGFLNLSHHMENVRERLSAMETEHLPSQHKIGAEEMLRDLYRRSELMFTRIETRICSGMIEDALDPDLQCVSPSDFGFHNAICTDNGVRFIDFEFAGWDDPAKSCADFILQQRNPVLLDPVGIASKFFPGEEMLLRDRIEAMTEILHVKWLCIILGILNPARLMEVVKTGQSLTERSIVETQLRRYYEYVAVSFPEHSH